MKSENKRPTKEAIRAAMDYAATANRDNSTLPEYTDIGRLALAFDAFVTDNPSALVRYSWASWQPFIERILRHLNGGPFPAPLLSGWSGGDKVIAYVEALEEALRPFAALAEDVNGVSNVGTVERFLEVSDIRRAAALLTPAGAQE